MLYSYIVKTLSDDSMIIYELTYNNGIIRISVYKFENVVKTFPRSIVSNYNSYNSSPLTKIHLRERRAMVVAEE